MAWTNFLVATTRQLMQSFWGFERFETFANHLPTMVALWRYGRLGNSTLLRRYRM
jgi:hypothetical protein